MNSFASSIIILVFSILLLLLSFNNNSNNSNSIFFVESAALTCPSTPGQPLIVDTSDISGIVISSNPLTCSVIIRDITTPSVTFQGLINSSSISITIERLVCTSTSTTTANKVCVDFTQELHSFDNIFINDVSQTYDNSLNTAASKGQVDFVQLIAFRELVSNGNSIIIQNANFENARVESTYASAAAGGTVFQFGIFFFGAPIQSIKNGVILRNSRFIGSFDDKTNGGAQVPGGVRFHGAIESTDIYIDGLNHTIYNSFSKNANSMLPIIFGDGMRNSGLKINNTYAGLHSFRSNSYLSNAFLSFGATSETAQIYSPKFFILEDVEYVANLDAGSQTETYFIQMGQAPKFTMDFNSASGALFRNVRWILRNPNSVSWSTNAFWWTRSSLINALFIVLDNVTWDSIVHTPADIWNSELIFIQNGVGALQFNLTNSNIHLDFREEGSGGGGQRNHKLLPWSIPTSSTSTTHQDLFLINNNITLLFKNEAPYTISIDGRFMNGRPIFGTTMVEMLNLTVVLDVSEPATNYEAETCTVRVLGPYTYPTISSPKANFIVRDVNMNVTMLLTKSMKADVAVMDFAGCFFSALAASIADEDCPVIMAENINVTFQSGSTAAPWLYSQEALDTKFDVDGALSTFPDENALPFKFSTFTMHLINFPATLLDRRFVHLKNVRGVAWSNAVVSAFVSLFYTQSAATDGVRQGFLVENCHVELVRVEPTLTAQVTVSLLHFDLLNNWMENWGAVVAMSSFDENGYGIIVRNSSCISSALSTNIAVHAIYLRGNRIRNIAGGFLFENNFVRAAGGVDDGENYLWTSIFSLIHWSSQSTYTTNFQNVPNLLLVGNVLEVGRGAYNYGVNVRVVDIQTRFLTATTSTPFEKLKLTRNRIQFVQKFVQAPDIDPDEGDGPADVFVSIFEERPTPTNTFCGAKEIIMDGCSIELVNRSLDEPMLAVNGSREFIAFRNDGSSFFKLLILNGMTGLQNPNIITVSNNFIKMDHSKIFQVSLASYGMWSVQHFLTEVYIFEVSRNALNALNDRDEMLSLLSGGQSRGKRNAQIQQDEEDLSSPLLSSSLLQNEYSSSSLRITGNSIFILNTTEHPILLDLYNLECVAHPIDFFAIFKLGQTYFPKAPVIISKPNVKILLYNNAIENYYPSACVIPAPHPESNLFWSTCSVMMIQENVELSASLIFMNNILIQDKVQILDYFTEKNNKNIPVANGERIVFTSSFSLISISANASSAFSSSSSTNSNNINGLLIRGGNNVIPSSRNNLEAIYSSSSSTLNIDQEQILFRIFPKTPSTSTWDFESIWPSPYQFYNMQPEPYSTHDKFLSSQFSKLPGLTSGSSSSSTTTLQWDLCANSWDGTSVMMNFFRLALPNTIGKLYEELSIDPETGKIPSSVVFQSPQFLSQLPPSIVLCTATKEPSKTLSISDETQSKTFHYLTPTKTLGIPPPTSTKTTSFSQDGLTPSETKDASKTVGDLDSPSLTHLETFSGNESTATLTFEIPKPPPKDRELLNGDGVNSASLAINGLAGATYATAARKSIAIATLGGCGSGSQESFTTDKSLTKEELQIAMTSFVQEKIVPLTRDANPLGFAIGSDLFATHRGAVVGNILIVFGCGFVHFLMCLTYYLLKNKNKNNNNHNSQDEDEKEEAPSVVATIWDGMKFFQFPGTTNIVLNVVFPGAIFSGAAMVTFAVSSSTSELVPRTILEDSSSNILYIMLTAVICILFPCILYAVWSYIIHTSQKLKPKKKKEKEKPNPLEKMMNITNPVKARRRNIFWKLYDFWCVPSRFWEDSSFRSLTGPAWDMWSEGAYLTIDWLAAVILSIVAGLSLVCDTDSCCTQYAATSVAVCGIQLFFLALWRPFLVMFDILALTIAALGNLVAACLILADFTTSSEYDDFFAQATAITLLSAFYGGLSSAVVSVLCVFGPILYDKIDSYCKKKKRRNSPFFDAGKNLKDQMSSELLSGFLSSPAKESKNEKEMRRIKRKGLRQPLQDENDENDEDNNAIDEDEILIEKMRSKVGKFKFVNLMEVDEERERKKKLQQNLIKNHAKQQNLQVLITSPQEKDISFFDHHHHHDHEIENNGSEINLFAHSLSKTTPRSVSPTKNNSRRTSSSALYSPTSNTNENKKKKKVKRSVSKQK